MVRHELWREEYRKNRYMEFLSRDALTERAKHIFENITILSDLGQISLHPIKGKGMYWMYVWTHLLEEFYLRYGPYPNGFTDGFIKDATIVKPSYPEQPKSKPIIDAIGGAKSGFIYKFGKHEHITNMHKNGVFRIAPASYYNDPSLNKAIRDDELSLKTSTRVNNLIIKQLNKQDIKTYGQVEVTIQSNTNYYVHCFASKYTYREFDDFDADSCMVISDPRALFKKMITAVKKSKPELRGFASPVEYIDPMNCTPDSIDIFFAKHFKYSYQNEVRIIWLPKESHFEFEPFFIDIGSLEKIAKVIRI